MACIGPGFEGLGGALGVARRLPLGLQLGAQFRHIAGWAEGAFAQVVFEPLEQAGQVGKQDFGINHGWASGEGRDSDVCIWTGWGYKAGQ
jgi:hypothetical protein